MKATYFDVSIVPKNNTLIVQVSCDNPIYSDQKVFTDETSAYRFIAECAQIVMNPSKQ